GGGSRVRRDPHRQRRGGHPGHRGRGPAHRGLAPPGPHPAREDAGRVDGRRSHRVRTVVEGRGQFLRDVMVGQHRRSSWLGPAPGRPVPSPDPPPPHPPPPPPPPPPR